MAQGAMRDCIQWGVVDELIKPTWAGGENDDPYYSTFNTFSDESGYGNPGYLPTQVPYVWNLLTNLALEATRNFHFDGHGNPGAIGDDKPESDPTGVTLGVGQVASALRNANGPGVGFWNQHPYRFVFLNACETAKNYDWAHAFGIKYYLEEKDLSYNPLAVQAFVGWKGSPRAANSTGEWYDEAETFAVFYGAWMNGMNLNQCLKMASSEYPFAPYDYSIHLDFPLGIKFNLAQVITHPIAALFQGLNNFHIKVYGYLGIKRTGYDGGF